MVSVKNVVAKHTIFQKIVTIVILSSFTQELSISALAKLATRNNNSVTKSDETLAERWGFSIAQ